jgi:hypothetical protein
MSLENVLEKISEEQIVANQDLNLVSPRVIAYKKGQVTAAKEKLELLRQDLKQEIIKRSVFIVVTGSEAQKFADIANQEFKCLSFSANRLATDIVNKLSDQLYLNRTLNANTFDIIDNLLEDEMKRLDIASYNKLAFNAKYLRNIKNKQDMIDLVNQAISDNVGSEVIGLDALDKTVNSVMDTKKVSRVVPIVLHTNNNSLTLDLAKNLKTITNKVFTVSAGTQTNLTNFTIEETNEETVGQTLKQIATNA